MSSKQQIFCTLTSEGGLKYFSFKPLVLLLIFSEFFSNIIGVFNELKVQDFFFIIL